MRLSSTLVKSGAALAVLAAGTAAGAALLAQPKGAPVTQPAAVHADSPKPAASVPERAAAGVASALRGAPAGAAASAPTPASTPTPGAASADGIALAGPHAAAVSVPSSPDAWGGPRTGREATLSDRVVHYDIDATLDPDKHTIDGRERLTWRNRSTVPVKSVYLHLYMNAFEGAGSTFFTEKRQRDKGFRSGVDIKEGEWGHIALRGVTQGGAKVPWTFVHPDGGPVTDHTVVRFDLPAAVAPGAATTVDIDFLAKLPRVMARTGYFGTFHLAGQWFPKIGVLELPGERGATAPRWNAHEFHLESEFYADFGSYDVKITAPKDYTVGATGERQGAPLAKGKLLTHRFVQGDVHDFAWTADKRTAKPLTGAWTGPGSPQVTVTVLYPPEYAASAAPALKAARDALTYFSNTLGPYPYKTLTVVIPPHNAEEAGGMEYPTFFTAEGYARVEPGTLNEYLLDFVTIHEFGHGYFYGLLASNEFEEPMLDEGLNQYWDDRMLRARSQKVFMGTPLTKRLGFAPGFDPFQADRIAAPRTEPADAPGQNAWDRLQGIGPVYVRTSTLMHDLEAHIGKVALERAFKEYYRRWHFRHPSIADLRETLAEASGQRAAVEAVFAQQVYAVARVDDRIGSFTSREQVPQPGTRLQGSAWVEDKQADLDKRIDTAREQWKKAHPNAKPGLGPYPWRTEVTLRRQGAPVPQTLIVRFADGSSDTVQWDGNERWRTFGWTRPAKAVSAELDPQQRHYLDVSKLDDSRTIEPDGSATRRWSLEFAAVVQYLLSLIANV
ncbi:M1 family metallopeptidase [Massilia forsythiae]|uniref:M1 family metallopeptidase n=1 Tax=Massilia forsythiae TaxID=2728020 RepID=A0A7Z2VTU2_9BURK|nr:M1 family metallopeptidase [Massilia forsythiae]QJD98819.1 M1 family metallopeptidase [Massilia forsythiae]